MWELVQFVAFWDQAYGEMQTASLAENDRQSMYSVGTGIRVRVWDKLYARVEWAWALGNLALTEAPEDRRKFYFRLTYEI
ncbi:MAG: hypothetical protein HY586_01855 [Candidatus Omnitrophica bacterium]|nr:hypothetical protein [Candidatus Omnitrophota bacterium]